MAEALLQGMLNRRSCRHYLRKQVPKELLEQVLNAGRLAPTGKNRQDFHFYVVTDFEKHSNIGKQLQPAVEKEYPQLQRARELKGVTNCLFYDPDVVVFCTVKKDGIATKYYDLGMALENMMLMAQLLGLATLPAAFPAWFGSELITKELHLPDDEEFCLTLSIGYADPTNPPKDQERKPMEELFTYL